MKTTGLTRRSLLQPDGRFVVFAVVVLSLQPLVAAGQGTVLELEGGTLTLSVGADDGVRVGMEGILVKAFTLGGETRRHRVARFEIVAVEAGQCTARVTRVERGWEIERGLEAVFRQRLPGLERPSLDVLPTPTPTPRRTLADSVAGGEVQTRRQPATDGGLAEARDRAASAVARRDWNAAVPWLDKLLDLDPGNETLRRAREWKREEAEAAFARGDLEAARRACNEGLAVFSDPALRTILSQVQSTEVLDRNQQVLADAREVIAELEAVAGGPPGVPLGEVEAADLLARRDAALADLRRVIPLSRGSSAPPVEELLQAVAGGAVVPVAATTYLMGCTEGDAECRDHEKPQRWAAVEAFWIDLTEVTVRQYRAFAAATGRTAPASPGFEQTFAHPVVNVSWHDAAGYCAWVGGRLPTEAEWELAARAGLVDRRYPKGDALDHEDANYEGVAGRDQWRHTSPVAAFQANPWGLYDMFGNVWEWVADSYSPVLGEDTGDPALDEIFASVKVIRGGSWLAHDGYLRASARLWYPPDRAMFNVGFRCVRDAAGPPPEAPP